MTPLLSADAMRAADDATISEWSVPGRVLMETAGRAAADQMLARWPAPARATVFVGTGNNGGDGLVVARVLAARGIPVQVVLAPGDGTTDRRGNLDLLRRLAEGGCPVEWREDPPPCETALVVDALLGIGASGPLREPVRAWCAWMDTADAPVVALDVPSGLDATTGRAAVGTPHADLTVAFGALKTGLVLGDGPAHAGETLAVEIGIPDAELRQRATAWRAPAAWAGRHLPARAADAHKYSAGRALAVVGSRAFSGAAVLSTAAAYRAGAGAVVACVPASAAPAVDAGNAEVMVDARPETDAGTLTHRDLDAILQRAGSADAVLVGCGLGRHRDTDALVWALTSRVEAPLVLDADALTAFADDADRFRQRAAPLVLTPHLGELRRLLGDPEFEPHDRVETVRELAAQWDAVLVLKGMPSVVGVPDGRVIVGPPGQPALATAGSGDTLAGTILGLLAQGLAPEAAAVCALHLGSAAARLWAETHAASGLVASDLVGLLPRAARALCS